MAWLAYYSSSEKLPILLFGGCLYLISLINKRQLDKNGIYVIGMVEDVSEAKNGDIVTSYYFYEQKKRQVSMKILASPFIKGERIFIRISPEENVAEIITDKRVGTCNDNDSSMYTNWKYLLFAYRIF